MTDRTNDHWHGRHYDAARIKGPVSFLNPTTRVLAVTGTSHHASDSDTRLASAENAPASGAAGATVQSQPHNGRHVRAYTVWHSRDNRKGRHALRLTPSTAAATPSSAAPRSTATTSALVTGLARMITHCPIWDVSYDVATIFTLGSLVWVVNGFFVLIPLTNPSSAFPGESAWGGGVSAVVGATIFEVGSVLLMIEAVNENRTECFGWALERAFEEGEREVLLKREAAACRHHHAEKGSFVSTNAGGDEDKARVASLDSRRKWTWWPSWYELRTHYFRDIGFLACLSQWIGATVFWISGFTGLPQILGVLTVPATNGIYWLPQVVGGTGFIISSWLFMLETQPKWYMPAFNVLGWHIGFWNLVGALGFTLCGALGFAESNQVCETALIWSTFIGSWAFLIGSVIQWYESLDKYPVTVDKTLPRSTITHDFGEKEDSRV